MDLKTVCEGVKGFKWPETGSREGFAVRLREVSS